MPEGPGGPRDAVLVVDKASIGFAAAHFSILDSGSETIHGHNYHVALEAAGHIRDDGTIVDFAALKDALRAECARLDHRMLVPERCDRLELRDSDGDVELREGARRFVFPRDEVVLLPVTNTTCECLAEHLLARLRATLGTLPVRLRLTVEESPGQGATVAET